MIFFKLGQKQKLFLLIVTAVALLIGSILIFLPKSAIAPTQTPSYVSAIFGSQTNNSFNLKIADTPATREQGLMHVTTLPKNEGMAFVFNDSKPRTFWMKNTLIPLDIIFINQGVINTIHHNVPPCKEDPCPRYSSNSPSDLVIELNGNTAKAAQIKERQHVDLNPNY